MRFQPKTDAEVEAEATKFSPWPNGTYDFEIAEAVDKTSAAGNDMLALTLNVFNAEGERRIIYDYLLEKIPQKLKHAAEACGLHSQYLLGELDKHDFHGKTGRLKLGIQPEKDGFAAKNVVRDYITAKASASVPRSAVARAPQRATVGASASAALDDEIPF